MSVEHMMTGVTLELVFVIVVINLFRKTNQNIGSREEITQFRLMQIFFLLQAVSWILWTLDTHGVLPLGFYGAWAVNMVYVVSYAQCLYRWFRFAAEKVRKEEFDHITRVTILIQHTAVSVLLFLIVTSVWTHNIFYVDASGMYYRGHLFWLNILLNLTQWVAATFLILSHVRASDRSAAWQMYRLLLLSTIPIAGGFLQFLFMNVPFNEASNFLAVLFMFTVLQEDQITTDALTGLNNRGQFETAYARRLSRADTDPFALYVADVDHFKQINDTHGHLAGDRALLAVAEGLRELGARYPSMGIYRYGGDEFVLLVPCKDIGEPDTLIPEIHQTLARPRKRPPWGSPWA